MRIQFALGGDFHYSGSGVLKSSVVSERELNILWKDHTNNGQSVKQKVLKENGPYDIITRLSWSNLH